MAAEAQENSANTDEGTQAQQEAADAENPSGVYRLVIQKGMSAVLYAKAGGEQSFPMRRRSGSIYRRSATLYACLATDIPYGLSNEEIQNSAGRTA